MTAESNGSAIGVILAGGASSRMGTDKAAALLAGRRLIDHVAAAVAGAGLRPVVAGPVRPNLEAEYVVDPPDVGGPSAGLVAAMRANPASDIVLVATDQPYLRSATLEQLLAIEGDLVAPLDKRCQTLCAVYRATALPLLENLIERRPNPSLQALFDLPESVRVLETTWQLWGEDGRSWLSIDTPRALAAAEAAWPDPPSGELELR